MTIETRIENGVGTVIPVGSIDSTTADQLDEAVAGFDFENLEALFFDFSGVDYISSKCLRILVSIRKKMGSKTITISGCNTTVADIFRLSGLAPLFDLK